MSIGSHPAQDSTGEALVLTREFNAPREVVFQAWTEPERVMRWWGPRGFTAPYCKIDLHPGGAWHYCMRSPEGRDYWCKGVYLEILRPERIVCTDAFSDDKGNLVEPAEYGMDGWPTETMITVTLAEHDGQTRLTLHHAIESAPAKERDMCREGWSQSLDKLADELASHP